MELVTYTIDIRDWIDFSGSSYRPARAFCVFAHALDCCAGSHHLVKDCPEDLLAQVLVKGNTSVSHPLLDTMKREALAEVLQKARRNAELIPELEAMLTGEVMA